MNEINDKIDDNLPSDISIDLNHEVQDDIDYDDYELKINVGKILTIKRRESGDDYSTQPSNQSILNLSAL